MRKQNTENKLSDPETWVDKYADYLYSFAMTRVRDNNIAEDLVQETFLAAIKSRNSYAGHSTEKTWLVGILKNKIIDHFRKSQREVNVEDIEAGYPREDDDFEITGNKSGRWKVNKRPADWMIDSADPAEIGEFWEFLRFCLSEIPKQIADIFVLREIDGLDSEEICNKINIKPTNLRVMLYRARKQIRRCLEVNWINKDKQIN